MCYSVLNRYIIQYDSKTYSFVIEVRHERRTLGVPNTSIHSIEFIVLLFTLCCWPSSLCRLDPCSSLMFNYLTSSIASGIEYKKQPAEQNLERNRLMISQASFHPFTYIDQ